MYYVQFLIVLNKPLWLPVSPPIPLERGKERSSKSRGNATRAIASPASTSRSEELTQSRHRGLTVDQVWSSSRQEQPLEMIPKSMILTVILCNSVLKLSYTMYKLVQTVNHLKIHIFISPYQTISNDNFFLFSLH